MKAPDEPPQQWLRPPPTRVQVRRDVLGAIGLALISLLLVELTRAFGALNGLTLPLWEQYALIAGTALPLALRRRFPISVMLTVAALFILVGTLVPQLGYQLTLQIGLFAAIFSAAAWSRNRQSLWIALGAVLLAMFVWLGISFAFASSVDFIAEIRGRPAESGSPLPPFGAYVVYNFAINMLYFGGAIATGLVAHRAAERSAVVAAQTRRIREQSEELARRAVSEERLRIARELHDVVAHHVAAAGVQAGAARRLLDVRGASEESAAVVAESLQGIEASSRQSVTEMRRLLGVLRAGPGDAGPPDRSPGPGIDQLRSLAAETPGLRVTFREAEDVPGDLSRAAPAVAQAIYRTGQEALANVQRHSTARAADMTLRTGGAAEPWIELEVLDDGRPRADAEFGSGFGIRGMRERAALQGGTVEAGPRAVGGWRVRVRYPLTGEGRP